MRSFRLETPLAAPPSACFDLSLSVDAHTASMTGSGERAVGGVNPGVMAMGDSVTWRAKHLGIWFEMTSVITAHDAPHRFVDEQRRGPFATWWHEHTFVPLPSGGTLMTDHIRYQAPYGPLGTTAERLVLDRYMPHLIRRRNAWLAERLGHGPAETDA